ncbi:MAG: PQQ-binding-like beta-propeller repeat protein [Verrucomicrobiales bacterium]
MKSFLPPAPRLSTLALGGLAFAASALVPAPAATEDWPQFQFDARHSGNALERDLDPASLGFLGAPPLSDGIYTSPVVADGKVYVVDGSGVAWCLDTDSLEVVWSFESRGGKLNCNNVSSPVVAGDYLHFGTTSGFYYVLDRSSGEMVAEIDCGEPVMSTPVAGDDRVYFATLGAQVYALSPVGEVAWTWDFVREEIGFEGNRWSGEDWVADGERVDWRDHFVCSRDICLVDRTLVIPAGGRTLFLADDGDAPRLRATGEIPAFAGREYPATFGQSVDAEGRVYVQWHRRDNAGRLDILEIDENDEISEEAFVPATETYISMDSLLSFSPVAIRDGAVYRVRPEHGFGLCRHLPDADEPEVLSPEAGLAPPSLTKDHVIYGDLGGTVRVVPLAGGETVSLPTAFGAAISAPVAVAGGKVFIPSEDGRLYVYGPGGSAELPDQDLETWRIRSPLAGKRAGPEYDWYTNYGDFSGTNANDQGLTAPLRMRWARRLEGTVKHLPVCGGGRLYTHTAEGQVIAVEQDTGRLLWRRHWPGVFLSFTSPLYFDGKLLVPQAGLRRSLMRCLDAETGEMLWEAPFTGSPSWSRQFPPVVHGNLAIYASGDGDYAAQGSEKFFTFRGDPVEVEEGREVMSFIYSNDNPYYPRNHRPRLWAWDLDTGEVVWEKDFSEYGRGGNDCGICLHDGKLYYSVFFGYSASEKARRGLPGDNNGLTASLDPETGEVAWLTTDYYVTSKCTLSARDGRLYIGGFNRPREGTDDRHVWSLNADNGELIWESEAVTSALNVVSVGERFIFSNALRGKGNVFDRDTGEVVFSIETPYACCRFTLSEPFVLGANMDMIDLSQDGKLVSTGPAIDSRECLGAVVSNGRIFYTSQASGIVVSQTYGAESATLPPAWEVR